MTNTDTNSLDTNGLGVDGSGVDLFSINGVSVDGPSSTGPDANSANTISYNEDDASLMINSKVNIITREKQSDTNSEIYYIWARIKSSQSPISLTIHLHYLALSLIYNSISIKNSQCSNKKQSTTFKQA